MNSETNPTTKTFDLKHPFQARGDQTYTNFTARDPKARDLKKFMKLSGDDETGAFAGCIGRPVRGLSGHHRRSPCQGLLQDEEVIRQLLRG